MTKKSLFLLMAAAACLAHADEYARVVSSVPSFVTVQVPRQICTSENVVRPGGKSGAGAVMGAVAGGALGNQIGQGTGRALATMAGVIGGAMAGNSIEGGRPDRVEQVQNCRTEYLAESRPAGYIVTYEYAGRQYQMTSSSDPGPYVRVQVVPVLPNAAAGTAPISYQTVPSRAPFISEAPMVPVMSGSGAPAF